jgi:hypothetical protein
MHLALTLKKQNRIIIFLFALIFLSNLLPLTLAFDTSDQIIMFNQVGQMASSMAYIHAAIPLNISTYQEHLSLFATTLNQITNTPADKNTPLVKSIKDMALFAAKRLNKLSTKLRTIDNVLPNDDFSSTLNSRQKRFVDFLFAPAIIDATRKHRNASLEGDLFDKNCNLKNLTAPPPYYFNPAQQPLRQGRFLGLIHHMIRKDHEKQEIARRKYLWACYLNKTASANQPSTTTPTPATKTPEIESPDYIDFHSFLTHTKPKQTTDTDIITTDKHRQKRQIFAAFGFIGG